MTWANTKTMTQLTRHRSSGIGHALLQTITHRTCPKLIWPVLRLHSFLSSKHPKFQAWACCFQEGPANQHDNEQRQERGIISARWPSFCAISKWWWWSAIAVSTMSLIRSRLLWNRAWMIWPAIEAPAPIRAPMRPETSGKLSDMKVPMRLRPPVTNQIAF